MTSLIWILLLVTLLQPMVARRFIEAARSRKIASIEHANGSRVILLVHRQESMSFLGVPLLRYIDIDDSEKVLRAIRMTDPQVPIDLVLHTPGGLVLAALQIARAIQRHPGKVTVYVPHHAMSGGTLIALAADDLVMCPDAVLGPVDPQVSDVPAASVLSVLERKPLEAIEDGTLMLADQAQKAMQQMRAAVLDLLNDRMEHAAASELADLLSQGTWTHDHPITFEEAQQLGLPAREDVPVALLELMDMFPQPTRAIPSVTYLPGERRLPTMPIGRQDR